MDRPTFRPLCPYVLNAKILSTAKLGVTDEKNTVISERLLYDYLEEFLDNEEAINNKNISIDFGFLKIRFKGKDIRLKGDYHFLFILKLLIEADKADRDFLEWNWFFVRREYVIEDPADSQHSIFFICKGSRILRDLVALSDDIPNDLLQERKKIFEYYWDNDQMDEMALTRICYENFYKETNFGMRLISAKKNQRDLEMFGSISPGIDDLSLVRMTQKSNLIIKELRILRWTIILAVIVIAVLLFLRR